jgi:hypothetical protein
MAGNEPEFIVLLRLLVDAIAWLTRQLINLLCIVPLAVACMLPWRTAAIVASIGDRCAGNDFRSSSRRNELAGYSFPGFAFSHFADTLTDMLTAAPAMVCLAMPWQWPTLFRILDAKAKRAQFYDHNARGQIWLSAFCGGAVVVATLLAAVALAVPTQTWVLVRGLPIIWDKKTPSGSARLSSGFSWVEEHRDRQLECVSFAATRGGRALLDVLAMAMAGLLAAFALVVPTQTRLLVCGLPLVWKSATSQIRTLGDASRVDDVYGWAGERDDRRFECCWWMAECGGRALLDLPCLAMGGAAALALPTGPRMLGRMVSHFSGAGRSRVDRGWNPGRGYTHKEGAAALKSCFVEGEWRGWALTVLLAGLVDTLLIVPCCLLLLVTLVRAYPLCCSLRDLGAKGAKSEHAHTDGFKIVGYDLAYRRCVLQHVSLLLADLLLLPLSLPIFITWCGAPPLPPREHNPSTPAGTPPFP